MLVIGRRIDRRLGIVIDVSRTQQWMTIALLVIGVQMLCHVCSAHKSTTESDDYLPCISKDELQHCHNNLMCNDIYTDPNNNNTLSYSIHLSDHSCVILFCTTLDSGNITCVLYEVDCSSDLCQDPEPPVESNDESNGAETALISIVVILIVVLLIAAFVILTLGLMVKDMKNERVQDGLPNPYSCIFAAVLLVFAALSCGSSEDEGDDDGEKPPVKTYTKPKNEKVTKSQKQQSEPESPDHDADDYEEMEHALKRDSFIEGGPEDIYQNQ